jgi:hypothetical protein
VAGGIGGRAHLHGLAHGARRSIPAQCMGLLCMPATTWVCVCRAAHRPFRAVRHIGQKMGDVHAGTLAPR